MATIPQFRLFSWRDVEAKSDLDRLRFVLDVMPDEPLMRTLECERGWGRDDYPVRAMWNSVLAGIVFGHPSVQSLRRDLSRNAELRELCGFNPKRGERAVPPHWVYSRFLRLLLGHAERVHQVAVDLVSRLAELLADFGCKLAMDGKALPSFGKPSELTETDGRRETDADWGKKQYSGTHADGRPWAKLVKWFGFKLHLLCDTTYELPVAWKVTKASVPDVAEAVPLVEQAATEQPVAMGRAEELAADKGYDDTKLVCHLWDERHIAPVDTKLVCHLWDERHIAPVVDIRNCWQDDKQGTRPLHEKWADQVVYDYKGTVSCLVPGTNGRKDELVPMAFVGFEADRGTLKYRCPAAAYGLDCPLRGTCGEGGKASPKGSKAGKAARPSQHGRVVRIKLSRERRIFTPIARSSYRWKHCYAKRTAVERINSRIDVSFGFEQHTTRGLAKMTLRVDLAMAVMVAMAVGSILSGQKERMRSLVEPVRRAA
jgi:hypothetical protein